MGVTVAGGTGGSTGAATEPPQATDYSVVIDDVTKIYRGRGPAVHALDNVTLNVQAGGVRVAGRRLRLRQVHAAEPGGRAGQARPPAR